MRIEHDKEDRRIKAYDDEGNAVGDIGYMLAEFNEIYATGLDVYADYKGLGYDIVLIDALADFARSEDTNIVPICPLVVAEFKMNPEKYRDVIGRKKK